ncbi:TauD/TfdA family dioxygenase [Salinispora arenicola]|uniref:TauD/TfdA family dioxygenase n=1 Tax=Salinispora arenicola TaxID=168697 RepID=UPI00038198DB|nr:TauD/TfdA family dioxygenase [Salinispora arenicola]
MIYHVRVDPHDSQARTRLAAALQGVGLATFEGVTDRASLLRLAGQVMHVWHHRDSEPDGVTAIGDRGELARRPGSAGFGRDELTVHTESSAEDQPPRLMLLFCARGAAAGGECRLVDGARLHHELAVRDPELLAALRTPRSVLFGGAAGHLGAVFAEHEGTTVVRFRLDDLARFSPQVTRKLASLQAVLRDLETSVPLRPGHGYLLCNTRWLHGRAAFTGERLMYRLLGNPLSAVEIPAGFATSLAEPATV